DIREASAVPEGSLPCVVRCLASEQLLRLGRTTASDPAPDAKRFLPYCCASPLSSSRTSPPVADGSFVRPAFLWSPALRASHAQKENRDRSPRFLRLSDIPGKEAASMECPFDSFPRPPNRCTATTGSALR